MGKKKNQNRNSREMRKEARRERDIFSSFFVIQVPTPKKKHTKTDCNLEIMTVLLLEKYCLSQHVHIILIIILVKTQLRQEKNLLLHRNPTYLYLYCLTVLYLLFTKKTHTLTNNTKITKPQLSQNLSLLLVLYNL